MILNFSIKSSRSQEPSFGDYPAEELIDWYIVFDSHQIVHLIQIIIQLVLLHLGYSELPSYTFFVNVWLLVAGKISKWRFSFSKKHCKVIGTANGTVKKCTVEPKNEMKTKKEHLKIIEDVWICQIMVCSCTCEVCPKIWGLDLHLQTFLHLSVYCYFLKWLVIIRMQIFF